MVSVAIATLLSPDRSRARRGRGRLLAAFTLVSALGAGPFAAPAGADEPRARVAAVPPAEVVGGRRTSDVSPAVKGSEADPAARARRLLADCKGRYASVQDYACTFYKRERIDGKLSESNAMTMKARTRPQSVYFKFLSPNAGREVIYVAGKNKGKIVAHEAGISKVIAGTLHLDPKGGMAMEENRHPITEAGIGFMIDKVLARWEADLSHPGTRVVIHPQARVGDHTCTMVEEIHPKKDASLLFLKVRIYIDHELGLPIRYEGYGWPNRPGQEPELVEEYTFMNLRTNIGLKDRDFDPANGQYSFGRF